jgi:glycosyltransferase involved in cell wall biosynthesis
VRIEGQTLTADDVDRDSSAPLVSVLTTSYNHARWLPDTLASVELQDYPHVEHIVVDDGSSDASTDLLAAAGNDRLRWLSTPHIGQAGALNEAFRRSTGGIIGWLSSDDAYYDRGVVRDVVEAFRRYPDAGVVYGHAVLIDEGGLQLHAEWVPPADVLGRQPPMQIFQPAAFVRRSAIGDALVDESFDIAMDTELWLRVRDTLRLVRVDRILAAERHQPSRKSYMLAAAGAEEAARLDRIYRLVGGHPINRRNRAWGIAYRLCGLVLIPRMARTQIVFDGRIDGRLALIGRQIAVPRSRMGKGRRSTRGNGRGMDALP